MLIERVGQHQATAAACAVNNIHLLRGMLGRPGAAVLQMNGQPTAQNNREHGADGDLPGFRNWENAEHVRELARLWNVDEAIIPHWAPLTHAMQIFRCAEQGSIKLLWIAATNPAVSMPDIGRIREILRDPALFVVVQDIFMTETAELADVVLPSATWGERTGTFTNADRTVHLSDKAVDPPGEARSDLDIFLDFARRMDFRDRDGQPLIGWHDPESAFEAWKRCSKGRPCDYSAMTYQRLREGTGIQWPCTDDLPGGRERLYTDARFNTDPDYCETFGHDLASGAPRDETQYRALAPAGRAFLYGVEYESAPETTDVEFPLFLTTGRTVYQFHTRSKTGRSPQLDRAASDAWVEISSVDAAALSVTEGDLVRVESRRGYVEVQARISDIRPGVVFVPFHFGSWASPTPTRPTAGRPIANDADRPRAANEMTLSVWDPVSKQPMFKVAAVRLIKLANGESPAPAPTTGASAPTADNDIPKTVGGEARWQRRSCPTNRPERRAEMQLGHYIRLLHHSQLNLASAFSEVASAHRDEPDVTVECTRFAEQDARHAARLEPFLERYDGDQMSASDRLHRQLFDGHRIGPLGLLRDLHDLDLMVCECAITSTVVGQGAQGARDTDLLRVVQTGNSDAVVHLSWVRSRMKQSAPQVLVVAP